MRRSWRPLSLTDACAKNSKWSNGSDKTGICETIHLSGAGRDALHGCGAALAGAHPLDHGHRGRGVLRAHRGLKQLPALGNAHLEAGALRQRPGDSCGAGGGDHPEFISGPRHLGLLGPALQSAGTDLPAVQSAVGGAERSLHLCG